MALRTAAELHRDRSGRCLEGNRPWHCPMSRWSQHRDRECQLAVGPMTPVRRLAHDGDDALGS